MTENIGEVAGQIWNYLNTNGPASVNKLTLETGANKNDIQRAIGWLLKEEKLHIEMQGRTETLSLK